MLERLLFSGLILSLFVCVGNSGTKPVTNKSNLVAEVNLMKIRL